MIEKKEFLYLYEKYLKGECTDQEKKQLESYSDEIQLSPDLWEDEEVSEEEVYNRIWYRLEKSRNNGISLKKNSNYSWLKIAAVLVIACTTFVWYLKKPDTVKSVVNTLAVKPPVVILPGKNKAYLTLANGQHIILNDVQNGKLATQSGIQVTKSKEGMLVYQIKPQHHEQSNNPIPEWNTIITPRGGQYQLVLADGTKVWLNAASSLTFTAAFTGKERRVKLVGEAYFEVAKNVKQPFVVETSEQEIKVLGTHFNVQAYTEEQKITTSLLEGKVNILSGGKVAYLQPGEEVVNQFNGRLQINQVEVEERIAWKNGFFKFNNAGIKEVMQQIARWYNIKVTYAGDLPLRQFNGTISRQVGIKEVLNMLKYTGIQFKIEGDQITVFQP